MAQKTHQLVKKAQITVPMLADYMAASEQRRRTIIRDCKYRRIARVVQHKEARAVVSNFLRSGSSDATALAEKATRLKNKLYDSDFERDTNQYNADYIARFSKVCGNLQLPDAELGAAQKSSKFSLNGVEVTLSTNFSLTRLTRTNKLKFGAAMLRYSKGIALDEDTAKHQSAAIFALSKSIEEEMAAEADKTLCLTIDAYSGVAYPAPGNSIYLFNQIKAACATIAERWPAIPEPPNAVL